MRPVQFSFPFGLSGQTVAGITKAMKQCLIFIAIINLAMMLFSAGCSAQERRKPEDFVRIR